MHTLLGEPVVLPAELQEVGHLLHELASVSLAPALGPDALKGSIAATGLPPQLMPVAARVGPQDLGIQKPQVLGAVQVRHKEQLPSKRSTGTVAAQAPELLEGIHLVLFQRIIQAVSAKDKLAFKAKFAWHRLGVPEKSPQGRGAPRHPALECPRPSL